MGNREINKGALDRVEAVRGALKVCGCSAHAFFHRATEVGEPPPGFNVDEAVRLYNAVQLHHCTRDVVPNHVLAFAVCATNQPSIKTYFREQTRKQRAVA